MGDSSRIVTVVPLGIDGARVEVEAQLIPGKAKFAIVGLPDGILRFRTFATVSLDIKPRCAISASRRKTNSFSPTICRRLQGDAWRKNYSLQA